MICFRCGKYGHTESGCMEDIGKGTTEKDQPRGEGVPEMEVSQAQPMQARADVNMENNTPTSAVNEGESKEEKSRDYGPWMIAQGRNRIKKIGRGDEFGKNNPKGIEKNKRDDMAEKSGEKGGSRFAVLQESKEDFQEGNHVHNPSIIFTGAPQRNIFNDNMHAKVRNSTGDKNPQRNVKGKNKTQVQKDQHGPYSRKAQNTQNMPDKGKKHMTEITKLARNMKHLARKHAAEQEMLAAMRILEK